MRNIWAVARVTIREALRQKSAVALLVLLAALLPALGFSVSGDATLHGRAQMFLDWSLRVSRLLLGLMTIFVACGTIAWELKYKHVYITLVKPIPRWQFLVGKWVGIGLLNVVLLGVVGLVVEGFAWEFRGRPALGWNGGPYWKVADVPIKSITEEGRQKETRERQILLREVLVARQSLQLITRDQLEAEVDAAWEGRLKTGNIPEGMNRQQLRDELRAQKIQDLASVPPMQHRDFKFTSLSTARRQGGFIQIRYSVQPGASTPNEMMSYLWRIGDPRKVQALDVPRKDELVRTLHTLRVPAELISEDGELVITFLNAHPDKPEQTFPSTVTFAGDGSLEVLYPVDDFESNLFRSLLMLLLQMVFMAALGLFAASFLTFPTACLMCLLIFFAASGVGYLNDALSWTYRDTSAVVSNVVTRATWPVVTAFLKSIPDFGLYSPSDAMVDGRLVGWGLGIDPSLGWALLDVGARTVIVLLAGCVILTRREVAQVVV